MGRHRGVKSVKGYICVFVCLATKATNNMAATSNNADTPAPCKRCKSKVVSGLKCKYCKQNYHPSCAKLSGIKIVNENFVDCCATDEDAAFFDSLEELSDSSKKVDITIFQYVVKQKDNLIRELYDKIDILKDQINHLKTNKVSIIDEKKQKEEKVISNETKSDKPKSDKTTQQKRQATNKNNVESKSEKNEVLSSKNKITINDLSKALTEADTQEKLNKYINITNEKTSRSDEHEKWRKVVRNKPRRSLIFGKNMTTEVKGVPKWAHLHVSRVDPSHTLEDMKNLLSVHFPEVKSEVFTPKQPSIYSSFKISIYENNFRQAMNPDLWPYGACISRFLQKTKIDNNQSK